jgi:hypothetical protein
MRFQVLTARNVKMAAFWNTAQCSVVEADRRFRGAYCLRHTREARVVNVFITLDLLLEVADC